MLDLTQLRTFVAVFQEGHLTRAAERLHISQPTASNHIRALETQFGVQLFHRGTRGLEPTPAGTRLAQRAAGLLGASMELTALARELGGSTSGRLLVGTVEDPQLLADLPRLVLWMQQRHPMLRLGFESRNSAAIRQGIATEELDAGFFVGSALEDGMDGFAVKPQEFVVAAPAAWAARFEQPDWHALAAAPWIVTRAGTSNAELAERLFRPHGLKINAAMEVSNEVLVRAMVQGGVGVGFVRYPHAQQGAAAGTLCIVPQTHCTTGLQFGYSALRRADPLIAALVAAMCETDLAPAGVRQAYAAASSTT